MDEAAEPVAVFDGGGWRAQGAEPPRGWLRWSEFQRAVRPVAVVVVDEDTEHAFEVAAVHDQEPVQALGAGGADEALGERVRFRCSHGSLDDLDAFADEDGVEVAGELAVAVADQEATRRWTLLQCPGELARLLGDLGTGRVRGAAGQVAASATELDEEEHVKPPQRDGLDGEEVDREHARRL